MNIINYETERENAINKICDFFGFEKPCLKSSTTNDSIKELCVVRLCKAVGLTRCNYKSDFFDFFSCAMGEAVCEKLSIKTHVACAELRLCKYDNINLVNRVKFYLDTETVEEAFIDAFILMDKFKYLIPTLKKV